MCVLGTADTFKASGHRHESECVEAQGITGTGVSNKKTTSLVYLLFGDFFLPFLTKPWRVLPFAQQTFAHLALLFSFLLSFFSINLILLVIAV